MKKRKKRYFSVIFETLFLILQEAGQHQLVSFSSSRSFSLNMHFTFQCLVLIIHGKTYNITCDTFNTEVDLSLLINDPLIKQV